MKLNEIRNKNIQGKEAQEETQKRNPKKKSKKPEEETRKEIQKKHNETQEEIQGRSPRKNPAKIEETQMKNETGKGYSLSDKQITDKQKNNQKQNMIRRKWKNVSEIKSGTLRKIIGV
ncbi:hypothetical protein RhiirA4_428757 [Rhizophagus irregularis]|uniref:Uncharacterized protein n=1 Tax=Rhizophagus irregularis TaxID=588596 RepID=A0A2I1HE40_9GLOM|nr:hypothetical protein RhiirA4_428757 [Rhizophagus irregularis]